MVIEEGLNDLEEPAVLSWFIHNNPGAWANLRHSKIRYVIIDERGSIRPISTESATLKQVA